jgi:two-component system, chemotaxis family, chemotaxis protein CheY
MGKILIVDDSEATRSSLKFSLGMRKFKTLGASNVSAAMNYLGDDSEDIKLVITDMNMPGMSGLDLIKHIREVLKLKTLPIIVLTTAEDKGKEALTRGATAFIMKSSKASEEILRFVTKYVPK